MWVELGHFSLMLALLLAVAQTFFGLAGPALRRDRWMATAASTAVGQFVFLAFATGVLVHAFVDNDFSVEYVAANSNSALPLFYRVTALWGAHEGSMLLWIDLLSIWTLAVVASRRGLPPEFAARVVGVLGFISTGFILFTLATSNPFLRLLPAAPDGNDLNPLLQDPAFAVHPPILYTGYVGLSVSFAFACAAMIGGRSDQLWARWMRPWTVVAWAFLTCGIALGSWWAYYELGWGGFWFWDPVENASFMPWLIATALIHSLAVTDRRGLFRAWTLLLSVTAFSLSLLGTFLVRSGVLVSVHSFAADPGRGVFILALLVIMIGGALTLFAWRAARMRSTAGFELLSRESFVLFNNILLTIAAAIVFGGTLAPLIAQSLGLGTLSVGPPYFDPSFMVPMLPLLALLGIGIQLRWKVGNFAAARGRLLTAFAVALALSLVLCLIVYARPSWLTPVGVFLGGWVIASSLIEPIQRLRLGQRLPATLVGMTLAHVGLGAFVLGITIVKSYTIERDIALRPGQVAQVGEYAFRYEGGSDIVGPNYEGFRGVVTITRGQHTVAVLKPEKRQYIVQGSVQTTAAIESGMGRDLLVALGEDVGNGAWSLRLQYRPLIRWIWLGALIMAIGGVTAVVGRRRRGPVEATVTRSQAVAAGAAAAGEKP